ncbi:hypothetical protein KCP70_23545 [Salmonella enterica subsp. enterica]|nr:hypothetical protein KCP70_23545 [Salmonella enterica subsp. enterica]
MWRHSCEGQREIAIFFLKSPDCGGNMQHVEKIAAVRTAVCIIAQRACCKMMADGTALW